MGTQIGELLEKEKISLEHLQGRIVGVDAFNTLYQFVSTIRGQDGTPLMDSRGRITSHLTGMLYRTTNLMEKGIRPVFVFDGKPSELKAETREKRSAIRTQAKEKFELAKREGREEDARKFASQAATITGDMVKEAKELASLMGIPIVQAPSEGEAQAAFMCAKGDVFGCVSQDYDSLLFGAPLLFRNIAVSGKRKVPGRNIYIDVEPERIELEKTLRILNIDRRKLVWIGILVGTDFNEKFPKVGPKTALKLVQAHDSFEKIIEETGHAPDFDYRKIEEIFLEQKPETSYSLEFREPQCEKIIDFLCAQRGFSEERVSNALKKIEAKAQEKGNQSSLDKWF
ncbi:MAG: flap endonuclease-1 [Candidatus Diapherotrites archaeon]|nr:flap endonuclease-1 [Candidatus Diapherotrites archaeon]